MLADPGAVLGEQRQRLFVGLTQFRAVFNRIQMADRREDASQHIVHFRQRLAKIFPAIRRAMRHRAFHRGPAILQRFVTAGTTCSGLIAEKGGREKGVNNGLVICAVLLKRVNEARVRRLCMRSRMGDSWGNFNDGRCVSLGIAAISPPVAGKARHAVQRAGNHINAFFAPSPRPPTDSAAARIAVRGWRRIAGNPPAARC